MESCRIYHELLGLRMMAYGPDTSSSTEVFLLLSNYLCRKATNTDIPFLSITCPVRMLSLLASTSGL